MADMTQQFVAEMMSIGIVSYREQETVWGIAKRCASTAGVPMAGAGVVLGGTLSLPGALVGLLAGLAGGTVTCTTMNMAYREQLRELARGQ